MIIFCMEHFLGLLSILFLASVSIWQNILYYCSNLELTGPTDH